MRAPLRFQELQEEVEAWCQTHGAGVQIEYSPADEEVPAFRICRAEDGRCLHFRLVKGWPPIIEVRRDDYPDDERNLRLLKVKNDNTWDPTLHKLLDPWNAGRPFDEAPPPLRFQELRREVETWCKEHQGDCETEFGEGLGGVEPAFSVVLPKDGRRLHFRMLKAWPPVVEARSDEPRKNGSCLLKVSPKNEWNPALHDVLDRWVMGHPLP
jgi:hypothetical protein